MKSLLKTSLWRRVCRGRVCSGVVGSFSSWARAHLTCPLSLLAVVSQVEGGSLQPLLCDGLEEIKTTSPCSLGPHQVTHPRTPFNLSVFQLPYICSLLPGHSIVFSYIFLQSITQNIISSVLNDVGSLTSWVLGIILLFIPKAKLLKGNHFSPNNFVLIINYILRPIEQELLWSPEFPIPRLKDELNS